MQSRNPLAGLSRRSWVAIALCLAHALTVRLAVALWRIFHQWMLVSMPRNGLAIRVPIELLALAWPVWLIALWPLIDPGRKRWVPVILAIGLACLGWEAFQFVVIYAAWLLEHGNLGN